MKIWILVPLTLLFEQYCMLYTNLALYSFTDLYKVDVFRHIYIFPNQLNAFFQSKTFHLSI